MTIQGRTKYFLCANARQRANFFPLSHMSEKFWTTRIIVHAKHARMFYVQVMELGIKVKIALRLNARPWEKVISYYLCMLYEQNLSMNQVSKLASTGAKKHAGKVWIGCCSIFLSHISLPIFLLFLSQLLRALFLHERVVGLGSRGISLW